MKSNKCEKNQPSKDLKTAKETYRDIAKKTPSAREAWRKVDLLEDAEHPMPEPPTPSDDECEEPSDGRKIPA